MPSAKQIKARKKFVRLYAKKGKRSSQKSVPIAYRKKAKKQDKARKKLEKQQREPTRQEFKRAGYSESEIDDYFDRKWDKKMQEFLNKSNNES